MYNDAWRIMRDWFYDAEMHTVDWDWVRRKYLPLVRHASHRSDLDFLIGELIGELNCGHTYVTQGETPSVDRFDVGLLGCEFEQVGDFYKITKIYTYRPLCTDFKRNYPRVQGDARYTNAELLPGLQTNSFQSIICSLESLLHTELDSNA